MADDFFRPDMFRPKTLPIHLDKADVSYEWAAKRPSKNKALLAAEADAKKEFADRYRSHSA